MEGEKAYQYWLHNLPGIGDRTIERLLKTFGNAKAIYYAGDEMLKRQLKKNVLEAVKEFSKTWEIENEYEKMCQSGIQFYTIEDKKYPSRLLELEHPPYALYCMGNMPKENRPAVAVIGARECSEYGRYVAEAFAGKMAAAGVSIISGMARGIDGIGQRAAIVNGGKTYAVLGSGVDVCYPAANKKLYQDIMDAGGGILSVFPPGTLPKKAQFPERNQIVAGLSDVILVIEARAKSGTWITVDMALEQGKNIYAVPGRLTDRLSDGCNLLIRQGAGIALTPEDILAELAVLNNRQGIMHKDGSEAKESQDNSILKSGESGILRFLDFYPKSADCILKEMKKAGEMMELPELLAELVALCVEGSIKQIAGSHFAKVR